MSEWPMKHAGPCACRFVREEEFGELQQVEYCARHARERDRIAELEQQLAAEREQTKLLRIERRAAFDAVRLDERENLGSVVKHLVQQVSDVTRERDARKADLAAERERADKAELLVSKLEPRSRELAEIAALTCDVLSDFETPDRPSATAVRRILAERDALKAELADMRGQADAVCCAISCTWDQAMAEARSLVIENDRLNDERDTLRAAIETHGAEAARLLAERDALKADAERYRWLREQNRDLEPGRFYVGLDDGTEIGWIGVDLDETIDAARAQKGGDDAEA